MNLKTPSWYKPCLMNMTPNHTKHETFEQSESFALNDFTLTHRGIWVISMGEVVSNIKFVHNTNLKLHFIGELSEKNNANDLKTEFLM